MAFDDTPKRLEAVFVQRDPANSSYEQINISASNAIVYLNEEGKIDVDPISDWAAKYNIGAGGGSQFSGQATFATQSLYATQSLTASTVPYNGNRAITRNDPVWQGVIPGGDDVVAFLDNFFYPFIEATIALNALSPTGPFETGSVNTITLGGSITRNNETVYGTTGSIRATGNTIISFPSASTFSQTDTNTSSSKTYTAYMTVNSPPVVIASSARSMNYYFPYLYGMSTTAGLTGTSLYSACTKILQASTATTTVSFIGSAVYMYFCYPASYPALTQILDPNLFNITTAFEHSSSVSITSVGLTTNWTQNYRVYRTTLLSSPNGNFQFRQ